VLQSRRRARTRCPAPPAVVFTWATCLRADDRAHESARLTLWARAHATVQAPRPAVIPEGAVPASSLPKDQQGLDAVHSSADAPTGRPRRGRPRRV